MKVFNSVLRIEEGRCPPDCSLCMDKCLEKHAQARSSAIKVLHLPEAEAHTALVCGQCGEPVCQECCPTGAISKDPDSGVVTIDEQSCMGCGLCSLVCPYGGAAYNVSTKHAVKCDQCGGDPACVQACPYGLISYVENRSVQDYLQIDDPLSKGTTMCPGCAAEISHRFTLRVLGREVILTGAPGCACSMILGMETPAGIKAPETVPCHMALLTNVASVMTGMKRYYQKIKRDVKVVSFVGDGATADIGFQPLSGAAERGENIIYICYDNEAYMNTGIQRSGTTPQGAWTTTSEVGRVQRGKRKTGKNVPLLMAMHDGVSYAATATVAYPLDYARKLKKAMEVTDGMVYIHLFSPCPVGWKGDSEKVIEMCQAAVESNYFPLWEADHGTFSITHLVENPRPLREFTSLMGRFKHLTNDELELMHQQASKRLAIIAKLAEVDA